MGIIALFGSAILFTIFAFVVLFALVNISSRLAILILFLVPLLGTLILPGTSIAFLSYQHFLLANGLIPVNNFHILLMVWSTLIGIVLYTEFLTWYLAKGKNESSTDIKLNVADVQKNLGAVIAGIKEKLPKRN